MIFFIYQTNPVQKIRKKSYFECQFLEKVLDDAGMLAEQPLIMITGNTGTDHLIITKPLNETP
jgi:hypothetical protein